MMFSLVATMLDVVDSCPIVNTVNGSCCEITSNKFSFTTVVHKSRVYNITNFCGDCEEVAEGYCDSVTAGGGWLVVQRRQDGSVDFNKNWVEYEDGFGSLTGELWYGLRPLHCLTNQGQWEMRIDFTLTDGNNSYLSYSSFRVGPASSNYQLSISGYKGIASTNPFRYSSLNGVPFTTKDKDNDKWSKNCAVHDVGGNAGGWWYNRCSHVHLNHQYKSNYGIYLSGSWKALSFTEIKIKPLDCKA